MIKAVIVLFARFVSNSANLTTDFFHCSLHQPDELWNTME
ncbi:hypothetical protein CHCC20347_2658 [Bacillus paralicheniformis]|nr:hypothetical protein CHCC20347_2658 [Bacillus paralicheniformis]